MSTLETQTQGSKFEAVDYDPFAGAAVARVVPTTEPQREIWLADRLGREASLAYNESISLEFSGKLDVDALIGAVRDLVSRHDALRSTVGASGETLQIAQDLLLDVPLNDLTSLTPAQRTAALAKAKQDAVVTPLDVEAGPLFRAEILRIEPSKHVLIITAHHILCDGWSFGVLVRDLANFYATRVGKPISALAPAPSYGDYATTQSTSLGLEQNVADEAYWLSEFRGSVPTLDLPTDRPRAAWRTFTSKREDFMLDQALVAAVRKVGAQSGASLFATLLGSFAALMHRVSGADDVVVGISAAAQSVGGLDNLVGHCVNMLPLRLAVAGEGAMKDLIGSAQTKTLDAYEHQQYTYGTLLKKLAVTRDPSRLPLVSVVFNIDQALDANSVGFPEVEAHFSSNPRSFENFELFINAVQAGGALCLECQYNADLFDQATIRRWLELYRESLVRLAASPQCTVSEALACSEHDKKLLAKWNATGKQYEPQLRLGDLVQRGLQTAPDGIAVLFEGRAVSHRELDDTAWQIAGHLRGLGAKPGQLIGVCLERSVELVSALVGTVYSGAAYVPLDPSYPTDRLARMCEDATLSIIITRRAELTKAGAAFPPAAKLFILDELQLSPVGTDSRHLVGDENDPAYVIFTSGSTGRPKGAMNAHKGIVNRLIWMQEAYQLTPQDRVVQKTPYSFDVSVWEFFWPLMMGATIVVAKPEGHRDAAYLVDLIRQNSVTVMHFVPSMLRIFLDEADLSGCKSVRRVVCSGEALPFDLVERFFKRLPQSRLANLYGPTEAAVDVTAWECQPNNSARIVPIGMPIANTQMHVLDGRLQPLPVGVYGELYIGGVQVGMGYVSRPDLTNERFLPDPFREGGRIYKTGDVARWRLDGSIEYMGRADHQVKIRGNRIELGEIETCLLGMKGVARAVVLAREDKAGDVRLVAYFVAGDGASLDDEKLRTHLKASLPEYMIPQHFVALREIPLLTNGKVDRKALPAPTVSQSAHAEFVAPRDSTEIAVVAELEKALGLPGVGIHDNFFSLGGHSLLAAQLIARLNRSFGTKLSIRTLFESPTAAQLAAAITSQQAIHTTAEETSQVAISRLADQSRAPMSVMQERLWFLEELYPGRVNYHAPSAHRLSGPMNEHAFERAFNEMIRRQPSLRTRFERVGNTAMQRIEEDVTVKLFPVEDLSALSHVEQSTRLEKRMDELAAMTFDLNSAPLFRAHVFKLGAAEHVLFFMAHHIIWDGWSFDLLYEELSALYGAYCDKREPELRALDMSYADYASWHRDWMKSEDFAKQLEFWRGRLDRIANFSELPTDMPRRSGMSGVGSTEWLVIEKSTIDSLHHVAQASEATLSMTLLAAYCVLLYGYSRQEGLVIGMPVRGRNAVEFEPIMGYFNNLLPLHVSVDPQESFAQLIKRVKTTVIESFTYPDVPLEQLGQELSSLRTNKSSLLYQALFSFQDARGRIKKWGDLEHQMVPIFQRGATEDLGVWFVEGGANTQGGITYNTDIFKPETARKLRLRLVAILSAVAANSSVKVESLISAMEAEFPQRHNDSKAIASSTAIPARTAAATPPASEMEKLLAGIWCSELKITGVGTEDNFFDLGGHSLLAMQVMNAMETSTGKRVNPQRFIFETLAQIAKAYEEAEVQAVEHPSAVKRLFSKLLGKKS